MLHFLDSRFEELLGALILAIMACISFVNVIIRYCTNLSFASSEELTVNLFVWVVLLGTARTFREGTNFSMNLLYSAFPPALRKGCYFFGVLCTTAFFLALFYFGCIEVMDEIDLEVVSESLAIPVWVYTIATPLFSLLILFRLFQRVREDLSKNHF